MCCLTVAEQGGFVRGLRGRFPGPTPRHPSQLSLKVASSGFPGGPGVRNPPADAGDMGSIPGPGRSRVPQGS